MEHILGHSTGKTQILLIFKENEHQWGQGGHFNQGPRYQNNNNYRVNNYNDGFRNQYQPQNQNQPQIFYQNTQPNTPHQMVVYTPNNNPGVTGGTQGDPSSQGTWNDNRQQQQLNGPAAGPSRGALELSE
jgi:hypothetical protein